MLTDQRLRERVVVLAGLVCGQTKSRAFSEYLIRSQAIAPEQVRSFSFREKDASRPACQLFREGDGFSEDGLPALGWPLWHNLAEAGNLPPGPAVFAMISSPKSQTLLSWTPGCRSMRSDGAWHEHCAGTIGAGTGANRRRDGAGRISMLPISIDKVIASQAGVVEQKRTQLAYRLWMNGRKGSSIAKASLPARPSWLKRQLLAARENVRATSHAAFSVAGSACKDIMQSYHSQMRAPRRRLDALLFPARCRNKAKGAISRLMNTLMPR